MPTWPTVVEAMTAKYPSTKMLDDRTLQVQIDFRDGEASRPQQAFIEHVWFGETHPHIAKVTSPIANVADVDLLQLAQAVDQRMLGGIAVLQDTVYVINSVPIDNTDMVAVENVLVLVALIAQRITDPAA